MLWELLTRKSTHCNFPHIIIINSAIEAIYAVVAYHNTWSIEIVTHCTFLNYAFWFGPIKSVVTLRVHYFVSRMCSFRKYVLIAGLIFTCRTMPNLDTPPQKKYKVYLPSIFLHLYSRHKAPSQENYQ